MLAYYIMLLAHSPFGFCYHNAMEVIALKGYKVQTGLRINEPLYHKVCDLAAREQRSLNNLIEYILYQYMEEYERSHGIILGRRNSPSDDKE